MKSPQPILSFPVLASSFEGIPTLRRYQRGACTWTQPPSAQGLPEIPGYVIAEGGARLFMRAMRRCYRQADATTRPVIRIQQLSLARGYFRAAGVFQCIAAYGRSIERIRRAA